ncbi:MAG: tRNA adenosine(34) deaminase TadA [Syntrophomonadaceae bacterium]|nr:tRNA adenosine(34) deaminase TadA [Syntrophomonadaceae bacterium]
MRIALGLAAAAEESNEVPVGAIIVLGDEIIARAFNEKERTGDPTAHAEMLAIRRAAQRLGTWRLSDATMYVTLEPCAMCAGAMIQARLGRLVYGAYDPKAGAAGSVLDILDLPWLNHQVKVKSGVLEAECSQLLSSFFSQMRRDG